jgi:excisionase family DNA binding protein
MFVKVYGGLSMDYLTPEEVAARLRVTPKTVRRYCQLGQLKAARVGRQWRISENMLEKFLNKEPDAPADKEPADLLGPTGRPATAIMIRLPY